MKKNILISDFILVAIENIKLDDQLTNLSLEPPALSLQKSIEDLGVINPVLLSTSGNYFRIISGHRRVKISLLLKIKQVPAVITNSKVSDESMLFFNLSENLSHHNYSDIEKGLVLSKLSDIKVPEGRILEKYMPIINLEPSKKILMDHLKINRFTPNLQILLHELNIPIKTFSVLFDWDHKSINSAESFFSSLRLGVNKWRDLLEWIDEISTRDGIIPFDLFNLMELQSILKQIDLSPNDKYDQIRQILYSRRYPILNDLKIRLARTLDKLKLDEKTRVHVQESFESDEIRIEMKFRSKKQLVNQVEKLVHASKSKAIDELISIFKNP